MLAHERDQQEQCTRVRRRGAKRRTGKPGCIEQPRTNKRADGTTDAHRHDGQREISGASVRGHLGGERDRRDDREFEPDQGNRDGDDTGDDTRLDERKHGEGDRRHAEPDEDGPSFPKPVRGDNRAALSCELGDAEQERNPTEPEQ